MVISKSILSLISLSLLSASAVTAIELEIKTPVGADELQTIKRHHEFVQYLDTIRTDENKRHIQIPSSLMYLRNDFVEWKTKFEKMYNSIEEEFERMLIWVQNHEFIETHNSQTPKPSYTVGHNRFSDMTNDEFQKMHSLGKYSPGADVIKAAHQKNIEEYAMRRVDKLVEQERNQFKAEYRYLRKLAISLDTDNMFFDDKWFADDDTDAVADDDDDEKPDKTDDNDTDGLPDEIDWVKNGAVTPVKNQGACGSCWAFSTTGSIEGASFIKTGELVSLSEQNLVDCDKNDNGCEGGMMETAFKFDEAAKGLCSEAEYPYLASDSGTCNTNCTKVAGSIVADYHDIPEKDKHGLIASIALQPTSIAMEAGQLGFQLYSSGVFSDKDCGATGAVDHGVLAVGYGTDADSSKDYFTVKNSWGADWGEQGYFRLDRKSDNEWGTCAILMIMTVPIMA